MKKSSTLGLILGFTAFASIAGITYMVGREATMGDQPVDSLRKINDILYRVSGGGGTNLSVTGISITASNLALTMDTNVWLAGGPGTNVSATLAGGPGTNVSATLVPGSWTNVNAAITAGTWTNVSATLSGGPGTNVSATLAGGPGTNVSATVVAGSWTNVSATLVPGLWTNVSICPTFGVTNLVTPLTNAATAGYIWAAFTNTIFRVNGGGACLQSFTYKAPTNPALSVFIFSKAPTVPTYNTAWGLTDADMQWLIGHFNLSTYVSAGTNYVCTVNNVNLPLVNKENTMLIYGIITTTSGTVSNFVGATNHQIRMSGYQD